MFKKSKNIKPYMHGFNYAIKFFHKIEDHHFHSYPGASWHDKESQDYYRKGIKFGLTYMFYRYEFLTFIILFVTILLFMFTW
jgi:hypothetical protein